MTQTAEAKSGYSQAGRWIDYTPHGEVAREGPRYVVHRITTHEGRDLMYSDYVVGTPTMNPWVSSRARTLDVALYFLGLGSISNAARVDLGDVDFVHHLGDVVQLSQVKVVLRPEMIVGAAVRAEPGVAVEGEPATLPESALIAREIRDLSGLSAEMLADVFPVERESYQRWMSGSRPSTANLERLLALRHFFRELAQRVAVPKTWLLAPLAEGSTSPTAYDVLKRADLAALWDAIADLPSHAPRSVRHVPDEGPVVVVEGSLRGRDYRTPEEELDDYDELLDAGE